MRYVLRICDRCGAEIERQRGFRAYDTIIQSGPEFCDSCKRDFAEFMEEGKKDDGLHLFVIPGEDVEEVPGDDEEECEDYVPSPFETPNSLGEEDENESVASIDMSQPAPPEIDLARNPYSCSHMTDRLYCTMFDASMRCCHDACYSCEHFDGEREEIE